MTLYESFSAGLLAGFSVAMPIGPMGLLCIQRTLASGMGAGVSTGLGAATVNVAYGAAILFGSGRLAPWLDRGDQAFSALGGLFLLYSAGRILARRATLADATRPSGSSPLAAYGSAVVFNATNPLAPLLILALLSPLLGGAIPSSQGTVALLTGMFAAAATWWVLLSGGVALLRGRLSPGMLGHVNQAAGMVLSVYGLLALAHSARL